MSVPHYKTPGSERRATRQGQHRGDSIQRPVELWVAPQVLVEVSVSFSSSLKLSPHSDGQNAEIVGDVCRARPLPSGVSEQLCGCLPPQTGEPGEQRVAGGLGQIPGSCQALCQPHHQAEVSHGDSISVPIGGNQPSRKLKNHNGKI